MYKIGISIDSNNSSGQFKGGGGIAPPIVTSIILDNDVDYTIAQLISNTLLETFIAIDTVVTGDLETINIGSLEMLNFGSQRENALLVGDIGVLLNTNPTLTTISLMGGNTTYSTQAYTSIATGLDIFLDGTAWTNAMIDQLFIDLEPFKANINSVRVLGINNGYPTATSVAERLLLETQGVIIEHNLEPLASISYSDTDQTFTEGVSGTTMLPTVNGELTNDIDLAYVDFEDWLLPDGLVVDSDTGAITVNPTVSGSFSFVVRATGYDNYTGYVEIQIDIVIAVGVTQRLIHVPFIGQSQLLGIGGVAQSALTTITIPNVLTLTGGITGGDVVAGELIELGEVTRETMGTSMGQQLWELLGSDPDIFICLTFHGKGGTTIQDLSLGGLHADVGYDDVIDATDRVKNRAEALGYTYEAHFGISHGGSGENGTLTYGEAVEKLITDFIANKASGVNVDTLIWSDQMRVAGGANDFGDQLYEVRDTFPTYKLTVPRQDALDAAEIQGDGVHLTNWGQRHNAMYFAKSMAEDILGTGSEPLRLDVENVTYDGDNEQLVFPVSGMTTSIAPTDDWNIGLRDNTNASDFTGTWSASGANAIFTITSSIPLGQTIDLEVTTAFDDTTGTFKDTRGSSDISFTNEAVSAYNVNKFLLRNTYNKQVLFPNVAVTNTVLINTNNSAGSNVDSTTDPTSRDWNNFDFGDTSITSLINTVGATIPGLTIAIAGFNSGNDSNGITYVDGINPPTLYESNHWLQNTSGTYTISGLTQGDEVVLKFRSCRDTAATNRVALISPAGATPQTIDAALDIPVTITFEAITVDVSGAIVVTVENDPVSGSAYAYVNSIDITIN